MGDQQREAWASQADHVRNVNFLAFWFALNAALRDHGQPDLKLADARHYWDIAQEELPNTHPAEPRE